jgi:hypothetical protein
MARKLEAFYWDENDRKDQEFRQNINAETIYSENACCDWCGDRLNGYTFECTVCGALLCPLHSCVDGRCPEHTGSGKEDSDAD